MRKSIRRFALCAMLLAGTAMAGCTATEIAATQAGVAAACATAEVGSTIYVSVESNLGGAASQSISQLVNSSATTACTSLTSAVNSEVASITAAGGTANVTVSTQAAAAPASKLRAKFKVRGVGAKQSVVFTVKPDISLPFGLGGVSF